MADGGRAGDEGKPLDPTAVLTAIADVLDASRLRFGVKGTLEHAQLAITIHEALMALPVEQRMDAMGMAVYGTTDWDDEEERDVVRDPVDVIPGAPLWVETTWLADQ